MHQLSGPAGWLLAWGCVVAAAPAQSGGRDPQGPQQVMTQEQPTAAAKATLGEAGTGSIEFRLSYYENDDQGGADGNPFLDESLEVIEPIVYFDYNTSDATKLWAQFAGDIVSSASIERLSRYPQQSGASGDYYIGVDVGATHQLRPDTQVGGFVHGSVEYDYRSFGIGGFVARDYDGRSRTLKLNGSVYFDNLDVIRFNGVDEGSDDRLAVNGGFDWYQVINARTHGEFGATLTYQSGFLSTPYNAVVVLDPNDPPNPALPNMDRGTEWAEALPDTRVRGALHGRVRHALSDRWAVELGGRLYGDDWGIFSVAVEPRVYTWLSRDDIRLRLRYRYYDQTAADDYQARYVAPPSEPPEFRTQDSDLAAFDSHLFGVRFDFFQSAGWRFDVGGDYTVRSDGLDFFFVSIGSSHRL